MSPAAESAAQHDSSTNRAGKLLDLALDPEFEQRRRLLEPLNKLARRDAPVTIGVQRLHRFSQRVLIRHAAALTSRDERDPRFLKVPGELTAIGEHA